MSPSDEINYESPSEEFTVKTWPEKGPQRKKKRPLQHGEDGAKPKAAKSLDVDMEKAATNSFETATWFVGMSDEHKKACATWMVSNADLSDEDRKLFLTWLEQNE
jgi:hypothetical protein